MDFNSDFLPALVQSKQMTQANEDELLRIAERKWEIESERKKRTMTNIILVEISLFELEIGKLFRFSSANKDKIIMKFVMIILEQSERNHRQLNIEKEN